MSQNGSGFSEQRQPVNGSSKKQRRIVHQKKMLQMGITPDNGLLNFTRGAHERLNDMFAKASSGAVVLWIAMELI